MSTEHQYSILSIVQIELLKYRMLPPRGGWHSSVDADGGHSPDLSFTESKSIPPPGCPVLMEYLVLLSSSLLVVVEDVLPDVLPALVLRWDVVHTSLAELIPTALLIPYGHCHEHSCRGKREIKTRMM